MTVYRILDGLASVLAALLVIAAGPLTPQALCAARAADTAPWAGHHHAEKAASDQAEVHVAMRDGVLLAATTWLPEGDGPFPAVLVRTAYSHEAYGLFADQMEQRGVAVVVVDARGRHGSGGVWEPLANEAADGQDLLRWLDAEPWCTGRIATFGGSYDAWVQLLAASRGAPELDTMILAALPGDPFRNAPYGGGVFHPPFVTWAAQNAGSTTQPLVVDRSFYDVVSSYPVTTWDNQLGRPVVWLDRWLQHWQLDEFWLDRSYEPFLAEVRVPVLMTTGWFDLNHPGSIRTFQKLRRHADPAVRDGVKLVVGPWHHGLGYLPTWGELEFPDNARFDHTTAWLDWIENHLTGAAQRPGAAVDFYMMGRNEWCAADEWPPRSTHELSLYLAADGRLTFGPPDEGVETYVYDPSEPTPVVEPLPDQVGSAFGHYPHELSALALRTDVLVFSTEPLGAAVAVAGPVLAEVVFSSSARDTDVAAQLVDITADGRTIAIQHGIQRVRFRDGAASPRELPPGEAASIEVDMWSTAYEFAAGHRIGVLISSAQFPAADAHRNLFDDLATGTERELATQSVHLGGPRSSRLILHRFVTPRRPSRRVSQ